LGRAKEAEPDNRTQTWRRKVPPPGAIREQHRLGNQKGEIEVIAAIFSVGRLRSSIVLSDAGLATFARRPISIYKKWRVEVFGNQGEAITTYALPYTYRRRIFRFFQRDFSSQVIVPKRLTMIVPMGQNMLAILRFRENSSIFFGPGLSPERHNSFFQHGLGITPGGWKKFYGLAIEWQNWPGQISEHCRTKNGALR
jgi:hypothetical protein